MKKQIIYFILIIIGLTSCQKEVIIRVTSTKANQNKTINFTVNNKNNSEIDKINIKIDGQDFKTIPYSNQFSFVLDEKYKLGNHQLTFDFEKDGKSLKQLQNNLVLYAGVTPKILKFKLINTYPHDIDAFTQGFEFYKDTLYEGTGLHGKSSLRKENVKTGKIYKKIDLDKEYFGEGITVLNGKVYQLTWQKGVGFVYDTNFNFIKDFKYDKSKEGWGLCNDGKNIYKSDGTEKIWTLDPKTLAEKDYIDVYTNSHKIQRINELEWVEGKIYTNVWQKNALAIINPKTGAVEGIINLSELHKKVTQHKNLDVLNGIAYDKKSGHLFVTGKMWDKVFEIQILK